MLGEEPYKLTLMLVCGLILLSLMVSISGCAHFSPTRTEVRYVAPSLDMVKNLDLPAYNGETGDDLMLYLDAVRQEVDTHNDDQQALRDVIVDLQSKDKGGH